MLELLDDPAYRHLLLNHLPITGLALAQVVLVLGAALREPTLSRVGLSLVALTAGASFFVAAAGDDAYPILYDTLDLDGRDWLDHHTELGERWLPLLYANAIGAAAALGVSAWRPRWLVPAAWLVALITLAGLAGATWIAEAGGKINHPEFRLEAPPR